MQSEKQQNDILTDAGKEALRTFSRTLDYLGSYAGLFIVIIDPSTKSAFLEWLKAKRPDIELPDVNHNFQEAWELFRNKTDDVNYLRTLKGIAFDCTSEGSTAFADLNMFVDRFQNVQGPVIFMTDEANVSKLQHQADFFERCSNAFQII